MGTVQPKLFNRDGSRNIYCRRCGRLVGKTSTMVNFGSVSACAVCDAIDNDIVLPDDVVESLKSDISLDGYMVPKFVFDVAKRQEEKRRLDPMAPSDKPEDRIGQQYWFRAAGLKVAKGFKEIVTKALGSQQLAREKKRARIFDRPVQDVIDEEDKDK